MKKVVPPNGCLYCGLERYMHGSRFDGLHPAGIQFWTAPTDSVRLARMLSNRRKRVAMNEDYSTPLKSMFITYYGRNDAWYGKEFEILDEGRQGSNRKIAFMADGEIQWRTLGNSFSKPYIKKEIKEMPSTTFANPDDDDFSEVLTNFLEPHKSSIEALDAEAARLRERLAEIEVAKKVLKSL